MDYSYRSSILCIVWISLVCGSCCAKPDNIIHVDPECPPWFFYNTRTRTCECYSSPSIDHIVKCTEKDALLKLGYCMTYEEESGFLQVGHCDNVNVSGLNMTQDNFIRLPSNISDLNDYMCSSMNRKGPLCSQCIDGFGFAVFLLSTSAPTALVCGMEYLFTYSSSLFQLLSSILLSCFSKSMSHQLLWWPLCYIVR